MVKIKRKLFMESSEKDWEARAVLNPSVVKTKDGVEHMFYRAVAKNWVSSIGYARIIDGKIESIPLKDMISEAIQEALKPLVKDMKKTWNLF